MATLALGCLYLSAALFCVWLLKNNFNFFDFMFNPANKKFYFILDSICIALCVLAISEQVHWLLIVLFLIHVLNSGVLLLDSNNFYESENQIREVGEDFEYIIKLHTHAIHQRNGTRIYKKDPENGQWVAGKTHSQD